MLPCLNEGGSIRAVIHDFRKNLPEAQIYVFDNGSSDSTVSKAKGAGAIVRSVRARGKGNVIRQAFAQIDADVYVLADGDGTYDAARAPELVATLWEQHLDMVVGTRDHGANPAAYRHGHQTANRLFNQLVQRLFTKTFVDVFSGYRAFSRPFVKSFPALATGFETETEMSLHAIQLGLPCLEIPTQYKPRSEDSESKLQSYRDGIRILWFIIRLLKHLRPLLLFASLAALTSGLALIIGIPVVIEFMETGIVFRLPTAVAAASLMVIAIVSLATGLMLDGITYAQTETKRLAYLSVRRLGAEPAEP
jgi:glycosyltransferase involved in cell wall biosynthesis